MLYIGHQEDGFNLAIQLFIHCGHLKLVFEIRDRAQTANDDIDVELMSSLGIYGPPAILFFDKNGNELRNRRVVGFMEADDFVNHINTTF